MKKGIFFAFIASIISGIAIFYSKISVTKLDPLVLTTSRNFIAALLLIDSYGLFGKRKELRNIKNNDLVKLFFIGIFGGGVPFVLFFSGLKMVDTAIVANLIQKTLFIWVSLLAIIFLKEKMNWKYWISFILVIFANFYFVKSSFHFGQGEVMILIATLLWSIESIVVKKVLKNVSSELVSVFRMGVGSIFLILSILFTGKLSSLLTINSYQLTIVFIGGTILFFYVFFLYKALKFAPVSLVTLILTFSVVVGNILNGSLAGVKIPITSTFIVFIANLILTDAVRKGWHGQVKIDE